ncbi:MAG: YraN family protein, partial [Chloroflexota bacterium]
AKGYKILERNWRCNRGEIDLVAQAGQTVVIVEVKTRRGRKMGAREAGLTPYKSDKLLQLGEIYVQENDLTDMNWRIDLVAVELDRSGKLLRCEHIPNAVLGW